MLTRPLLLTQTMFSGLKKVRDDWHLTQGAFIFAPKLCLSRGVKPEFGTM
jgi:hypothetical protein